jgi:hypothetical protein
MTRYQCLRKMVKIRREMRNPRERAWLRSMRISVDRLLNDNPPHMGGWR